MSTFRDSLVLFAQELQTAVNVFGLPRLSVGLDPLNNQDPTPKLAQRFEIVDSYNVTDISIWMLQLIQPLPGKKFNKFFLQ